MPTSRLSRNIFHGIIFHDATPLFGCLHQRALHHALHHGSCRSNFIRKRSIPGNAFPLVQRQQRRTKFNLSMFAKPEGAERSPDLDPGIETMMHYAKMVRARARLPDKEKVARALSDFVSYKYIEHEQMQDTHAQLMLQSLRYCTEDDKGQPQVLQVDGKKTLLWSNKVLSRTNVNRVQPAHIDLAEFLFDYCRLVYGAKEQKQSLRTFVRLLGSAGLPERARYTILNLQEALRSENSPSLRGSDDIREMADEDPEVGSLEQQDYPWLYVLKGYAIKGDEKELLATLEMMKERGFTGSTAVSLAMLRFYAENGNLDRVRHWWMQTIQSMPNPSEALPHEFVHFILQWCLRKGEISFGEEVLRTVMQSNPRKEIWDATFVWAAGTGKGIEGIDRMISVMVNLNESIEDRSQWREPDTATINSLVEFAISRNDPYMAERFISLGRDRKIQPDARTFLLQMQYRLDVNDISGALNSYNTLRSMDSLTPPDADLTAINRLVVAMCTRKSHDFDTIMNIAADLTDRGARFEPSTTETLSLVHLSRGEVDDVMDLLKTHAFHYSNSERSHIRQTIINHCLEAKTPTGSGWGAYSVLNSIFDEMPREERTQLMTHFLHRKRPDMAIHIFNHMRRSVRSEVIPNVETYVSAFMGMAALGDLDKLEIIHNQLKLDCNIDMSTYLYNALIIAYTACGRSNQALGFWDDIAGSKEGPTYSSILVALRACEGARYGDTKAQTIWERLRRTDIELDKNMWASYIAALAGEGNYSLAVNTLEAAVEQGELELDAYVCGSLFNACPDALRQSEVARWIVSTNPMIWREIEDIGYTVDDWDRRQINIDRTIKL